MNPLYKILNNILLLIALLFCCSACQEPYNEDYITGNEKIPVILGALTEGPGPFTINLKWASSFKKYINSPIFDAKITISDNEGNSELLMEQGSGNYVTKATGIRGVIGRKYKISIKLIGGKVLESPFIMLEPALMVDTMYAEAGKKTDYEKNSDNEIVTTTRDGLFIYADIKPVTGETKYIKFDNSYVWQITRLLHPHSDNPPIIYYRNIYKLTDLPDVKATILHYNNQEIIKQPIGFLPYISDFSEGFDSVSAFTNAGWIMCANVSTISKSAFNYYDNITKQLKSGSKIFDPIPSQITSNIKCISDSTYLVFGLFDVYTSSVKYTGFMMYFNSEVPVRSKNVYYPGPMVDEYLVNTPFPYWLTFNNN